MAHRLPQTFDRLTTLRYHLTLMASLLPIVALALVQHGWPVLINTSLAVGTAWLADVLLRRFRAEPSRQDGAAPLWGLLLALLLPVGAPPYLPILGALFAVFVVKSLLGGSTPWINPVLASWAFLQVGWGGQFPGLTPLAAAQRSAFDERAVEWLNTNVFSWFSIQLPSGYVDLFFGWGHPSTSLVVESGSLVLLAATVYLLAKGLIPWHIPAAFFVGFSVPLIFAGADTLYQVFSGTLLINLFFLATDPSSRPLGRWTLVAYGLGAGLLAALLRLWGTGSDPVGYAVLFLNFLVPWIDRRFRRKPLNDFRLA